MSIFEQVTNLIRADVRSYSLRYKLQNVIYDEPSKIDGDNAAQYAYRETLGANHAANQATVYADLVSWGISLADWVGITNELRGEGDTTEDRADRWNAQEVGAYQGWINYPTWAIALWLSNEYASYRQVCDLVDHHGVNYRAVSEAIKVMIMGDEIPRYWRKAIKDALDLVFALVSWDDIALSFYEDDPRLALPSADSSH